MWNGKDTIEYAEASFFFFLIIIKEVVIMVSGITGIIFASTFEVIQGDYKV